jgi:hypothetical protein
MYIWTEWVIYETRGGGFCTSWKSPLSTRSCSNRYKMQEIFSNGYSSGWYKIRRSLTDTKGFCTKICKKKNIFNRLGGPQRKKLGLEYMTFISPFERDCKRRLFWNNKNSIWNIQSTLWINYLICAKCFLFSEAANTNTTYVNNVSGN